MRKLLVLLLCLSVHGMARGQTSIVEYRYWFDEDSVMYTGQFEAPHGYFNLSTEGLDDQPHLLHLQIQDTDGVWSSPVSRLFQKQTGDPNGPFTYHIWNNQDTEHTDKGMLTNDVLHLDMTNVAEGPSQLYVQVSQGNDYSPPVMKSFIKLPVIDEDSHLSCSMEIDGKPYRKEKVSMNGGSVNWIVDTDTLETGIHRYTIMAATHTGESASIKEGFFICENMDSELAGQRCYYQVDGDTVVVTAGAIINGQYHYDLDMSGLDNGLHEMTYWQVTDNGYTTNAKNAFFIKTTLDDTGIIAYDYWVNDKFEGEGSGKQTITLEQPNNPMTLIKALPMPSDDVRSSKFKFGFINDGSFGKAYPVIYAKNDFHIRFLDVSGQYVEATKEYVDESTYQWVIPADEIRVTQTFDRVEENGIRWYSVNVEEGDTVAFRSSLSCTMQLFSPTGEEICRVSGDSSVVFVESTIKERGTHYLAVHDVTGDAATQTLEYQRMGTVFYTSLSDGVLTLYFDNQMAKRGNSSGIHLMGGYEDDPHYAAFGTKAYNPYSGPAAEHPDAVRKVVLDESIVQLRPTTLYRWFDNFTSLVDIEGLDLLHTSEVVNMTKMFAGCSSLHDIDLHLMAPKIIGDSMFYDCKSLGSVEIPACVETIGDHAFYGCTAMNGVKCDIPDPIEIAEDVFDHYEGCVLVVPSGSAPSYRLAEVWKKFYRIAEMGDVNADSKINGSDIVEMVDHIMGRPSLKFVKEAADLTGDRKINGSDLTEEISLVMSQSVLQIAPRTVQEECIDDALILKENADNSLSMGVRDNGAFILTQMKIKLSDGLDLMDITSDDDHHVVYEPISDHEYFVLCYSSDNTSFADNQSILTLQIVGAGTVTISEAMIVDSERQEHHYHAVSSQTTGVRLLEDLFSQPCDIYTTEGMLVRKQALSTKGLAKGIYIVNGKKCAVK